ncbi:hypothetical protein AAC387_Pa12g2347 [Persea americana]
MGHKVESAHVGSRVLPICNVAAPALGSPDAGNSSDASLNKKRRAISRMKELPRRAVTTKSEKGENKPWKKVLKFRSRGALRAPSDDMGSYSRISFSWDMGSCSTTSALSPLSLTSSTASHITKSKDLKQQLESISKETSASPRTVEILRRGNWISTDSEYVVLEL